MRTPEEKRERQLAYMRKWRLDPLNREKERLQRKIRYHRDPQVRAKAAAGRRAWQAKNPEKARSYSIRWRDAHRELIAERDRIRRAKRRRQPDMFDISLPRTVEQPTMIGDKYLPHTEQQAATIPGMAHLAYTGPLGATCGKCRHYVSHPDTSRGMRCDRFLAMMHKWGAAPIPFGTPACKYFEKR